MIYVIYEGIIVYLHFGISCSIFISQVTGMHEGQAWRSGEVLPTCAKRSWFRRGLSALHCAGVRLALYNPSPAPPGVGAISTGSVL